MKTKCSPQTGTVEKESKLAQIKDTQYQKSYENLTEPIFIPGASPLHLAIAYNNVDFSNMLIDVGADVNQQAVGTFCSMSYFSHENMYFLL